MPVPVPRSTKPPSHPIVKSHRVNGQGSPNHSVFQNLTQTLPVSPRRPPPSFGTREEWINSLPSWRRSKPRIIWEETHGAVDRKNDFFQHGLTAAVNASVIKGNHAQACPPPVYTPLLDDTAPDVSPISCLPHSTLSVFDGDADDEMSSQSSTQDLSPTSVTCWMAGSPIRNLDHHLDQEKSPRSRISVVSPAYIRGEMDAHINEKGAFSPVVEDRSSDGFGDDISSPAGPVTPFGEFVDRVVAEAANDHAEFEWSAHRQDAPQDGSCDVASFQSPGPQNVEIPKEPAPPESAVAPCATPAYKALAEPLAEWVANYVWKACTTGMTLPAVYKPVSASYCYSDTPPIYLAESVHSVLLSTLLQPSAVFLAVWYIVRLPVYFGHLVLDASQVKERNLREELLGDFSGGLEPNVMQATAPFRLILLGCMLANKWLDDHTFSNKTWHAISNVPIRSINRLESLALELFEFDLSVPAQAWAQWLAHVQSYHMSLASPAYPQPISRPSTNPHAIIRKVIDELVDSPVCCELCRAEHGPGVVFEPVFIGLQERRKDKEEKSSANQVDTLEIDLDEDGPLREEYLPRRRSSGVSSNQHSRDSSRHSLREVDKRASSMTLKERHLPPPSEWSPAGDEPILREKDRDHTRYVAVQPPFAYLIPPPGYPPFSDARYHGSYRSGSRCNCQVFDPIGTHEAHVQGLLPPPYTESADGAYAPLLHSCFLPQPYCCEKLQLNAPFPAQPRYDYRCADMGVTAGDFRPFGPRDALWAEPYLYPAPRHQPYGPIPNVGFQLTWHGA